MDLRKLKTILELFENSRVSELEISEGEDRVRLSRGVAETSSGTSSAARPAAALAAAPAEAAGGAGCGGRGGGGGAGDGGEISDGGDVLSGGVAGSSAVCERGEAGGKGRDAMHHRGDEADERAAFAGIRGGAAGDCGERRAGGFWGFVVCD